MITKASFLQNALFVLAAISLVNCSPATPCPFGGSTTGGTARMRRPADAGMCTTSGGGGGGTCSSTLTPTQVMLSVDTNGNVLEYGIDSTTGALTLMCNTATAASGPLAVSNNNFLYILDTSTTPAQVFGFIIAHGKSGALAALTGSPFKLSENISGFAAIVPDPLGRFLFVTNQSGNDVHVLTITAGALAEATNSPFAVQTPDHIAITTAGTFAYVPDSTDGNIFIFSLSATGQLVSAASSPLIIPNTFDRASFAIVHPTANFLFTADIESVASYATDPNTGALTLVNGSTVSTGGSQVTPAALALDGTGKFLYVTPVGANGLNSNLSTNILGYQIDTTGGGLTLVPNAPFTSTSTLDVIANPLGQELYIFSEPTTPTVVAFTAPIDTFGNLTIPTTGLTVTADASPVIANIQ
jgi:6-phosphogluconolactonase (cycloisomerase 2 family)